MTEKTYEIKVIEGVDGPGRSTLRSIYLTKAFIYPSIIPNKFKSSIERLQLINRINFVVYSASTLVILFTNKRNRPDSMKKVFLLSLIYYFTYLFFNWKIKSLYNESFEELKRQKSEEEIIDLINNVSKKTKILY